MKKTKQRILILVSFVLCMVIILVWYSQFSKKTKVISSELSGSNFSIDCGNGISMDFVRIDSGIFEMGSDEEVGDADETPKHEVTITKPFYIGTYEVTQAQWKQVMGELPCEGKGDTYPVDSVSWKDCQEFLEKLEDLTGYQFSLPTEAQWEYSCRAGTTAKWFFGDDSDELSTYAWVGEDVTSTMPVGQKEPNPWGLYDMYGNVQEWCQDWYENPYSTTETVDPTGPDSGASKVIRGGGWGDTEEMIRSAYRNANGEEEQNDGTGFRCVLVIEE